MESALRIPGIAMEMTIALTVAMKLDVSSFSYIA
jgi:hypothetical protein